MSKKAFKSINLDYEQVRKENNTLEVFLNDKYTGEIYDIKTFSRFPSGNDLYYAIIYEKLTEDDISEDKSVIKKEIKTIKQSKTKPKLL
jgi:hypothetical protein